MKNDSYYEMIVPWVTHNCAMSVRKNVSLRDLKPNLDSTMIDLPKTNGNNHRLTHRSMTGWISADRRTKSALMLTIPAPSYVVCIRCTTSTSRILNVTRKWKFGTKLYLLADIMEAMKSFAFSISSDLEAFSLSWAGGSFAALVVQLAASPSTWTSGSSRTKLDYCCKTIISRIKLTCLATV